MTDNRATGKDIWVPQTTTKATVINGAVSVWEELTMVSRPIKPPTGFTK